jgi:EAL domain-containing protein (putative c-di-GMP-specific phosphodiesterase class I)/ActR/RegA family two-component response regulator
MMVAKAESSLPRPNLLRHALIVDDEAQVRAFIARTLSGAGFVTHECARVPEVEAALTQFKPEIIVLDLSLGGADGIEIMRSLAAARFTGKVLLVSGHNTATLDEARKIGERRGLDMMPVLRKPFRGDDLRARIDEMGEMPAATSGGTDLETALQNNWLELWYQPKIELRTMKVAGAEALVRMRHPECGVIQPAAFLPPPGHRLYEPLTDFVVRRALADWSALAAWPSIGEEWASKRIALNVPASLLHTSHFMENLRRHLPDHPRFPGLIVEITEDEAIADPEQAREIAVQLRLYNVHVSIDDFGIGHSLLTRLAELPFAELKLDRSFVTGCAHDHTKRWTCQTVVDLAHRFGLTAVAEGVENAEDLEQLADMGYDMAQGFYFAKPMKSTDFATMLMSRGSSSQSWPLG